MDIGGLVGWIWFDEESLNEDQGGNLLCWTHFLMAACVSDSLSPVGSDGGRRGVGSEAVRRISAEECLQAG